MLVQALAAYADTYLADQLSDEAWEEKPVPYMLAIDGTGTFLNVIPHNIGAVRGKKTVSIAAPLSVPRSPVPRNAGLYPLLAADDIKYVLGAGPWTAKGQEQNNQERFVAFAELIQLSSRQTNDEALTACAAFYERAEEVERARAAMAEAKAGSLVALWVDGPVVKRPAVRVHWSNLYEVAAGGRVAKGGNAECLISGKLGPIAPTHEKIKGLASLGGQSSGVSLMSFDKEAFCSYGWEQNANSPVSAGRAMAYVLALNDLLRRESGHRRDIAGVGFLFWTKERIDLDLMALIDQPEASQVERLLQLDSNAAIGGPDPNMFYMAGVAGNGARMLVRYWIAETLSEVKANLKDWFAGLRVADVFTGKISEPPKLWQLLYAIEREGEPSADRVVALIKRAIEGPSQPLGYRMLTAALTRLRVDPKRRLEPVRMGLIRLCVNDSIRLKKKGEKFMTESLDLEQRHPAYLCGRLLAVYDSLQYKASGDVGQTVADRYYSLASTYPEMAFPKMQDLGNKHLKKLRREERGAATNFAKELDNLHLEIEQASGYRFPKALDLDGQGRFALGYHHQRAHQMERAMTAKGKRESTEANTEVNEETL